MPSFIGRFLVVVGFSAMMSLMFLFDLTSCSKDFISSTGYHMARGTWLNIYLQITTGSVNYTKNLKRSNCYSTEVKKAGNTFLKSITFHICTAKKIQMCQFPVKGN